MPYRKSLGNCVFLFALVAFALPAADAKDVAFGALHKDGRISNIVYYRNGSWVKALVELDKLPLPDQEIVRSWIESKLRNSEPYCPPPASCCREFICGTLKPLRPYHLMTAEELAAYLGTMRTTDADHIAADQLARMLAWDKAQNAAWYKANKQKQNRPSPTDIKTYAEVFWNSDASTFSRWYRIGDPSDSAPIRVVHAGHEGSAGDCGGAEREIQSDSGGDKNQKPGWVATQRSGFSWGGFENVVYVGKDAQWKPLAIPEQHAPLAEQVKISWSKLEGDTIAGIEYAPAYQHAELKSALRATPFFHFAIERAAWARDNVTLLFFHASKSFNSPVFRKYVESIGSSVGDTTQVIDYRGWAVVQQDGKVSWPSAFVHLTPGYGSRVSSYRRVHPIALIELEGDGRRFLLADSHVEYGNAGTAEVEIFELVDGKFRSHGRYPGSCGGFTVQ